MAKLRPYVSQCTVAHCKESKYQKLPVWAAPLRHTKAEVHSDPVTPPRTCLSETPPFLLQKPTFGGSRGNGGPCPVEVPGRKSSLSPTALLRWPSVSLNNNSGTSEWTQSWSLQCDLCKVIQFCVLNFLNAELKCIVECTVVQCGFL